MRSPSDIHAQALRLWERHEILRAELSGEVLFPWSLPLNPPAGNAVLKDHAVIAQSISELAKSEIQNAFTIEWVERRLRGAGEQRLPQRAVFTDRETFLRFLGKQNDFAAQMAVVERLRTQFPVLLEWAAKTPARLAQHTEVFEQLLDIVDWLSRNPAPNRYPRELPIPSVDSKFIGSHRKILSTLLDLCLPPEAINATTPPHPAASFEHRYGLRYEQPSLRLRLLDGRLSPLPGIADLSLPRDQFARLNLPIKKVFITENKTNFLAFPDVANAAVIFGRGYAIDELAHIDWLKPLPVYYWGDIDTHGFNILNRLRDWLPQTCSLLMDETTLLRHEDLWGREPLPVDATLTRLTVAEQALYRNLLVRHSGTRLEQERIPIRELKAAIANI